MNEMIILAITAASIGFFHTLFGPDHYIPFIVMSRARNWSMFKTSWITFLCGLGHILSSVLLGFIGIALGIAVTRLEAVESSRGEVAAWLLIAFGLVYFVYGVRKAYVNKPHKHWHDHESGESHQHGHVHSDDHVHVHEKEGKFNLTPWVLFTIFVFGPCEPLIPLVMYPAAKSSMIGVILVTTIFGTITIGTMMSLVLITSFGINLIPVGRLERYSHAIAGATIFVCGLAIQFLGL
ncbi:sulfite exporter TauE/SafE family protein [bacterium]|nr:sulfite exporter TauE/SafE family protein [bacterium]